MGKELVLIDQKQRSSQNNILVINMKLYLCP